MVQQTPEDSLSNRDNVPSTLETSAVQTENLVLGIAKTKRKRGRPLKTKKRKKISSSSKLPPQQPEVKGDGITETQVIIGNLEVSQSLKVPKKRGRKSKAELMMMRLSQDLECRTPELSHNHKLEESYTIDDTETTPGGRPKRRAAKMALLFLQELAEDLSSTYPASVANHAEENTQPSDLDAPVQKKRGSKKKKEDYDDDDVSRDADFVLTEEEKEEDEQDEEGNDFSDEASDSELETQRRSFPRTLCNKSKQSENGFHNCIMFPVWKCCRVTMDYEYCKYLPQETKSPLFTIRREGITEDEACYRIKRFNSLQPHEERWDSTFFVGGPVWSMEWCPTPEGSAACQYVALYCNERMDETHKIEKAHISPGLLQLWNLGHLQQETCSTTKATFTYGIAVDLGCIWDLKFCPSGAWELPSTHRKNPQMPRLGLLAAAFSGGNVEIYSLPHPDSLYAHKKMQVKDSHLAKYTICKVQCVASLHVGAVQVDTSAECGQCFSLSWMPSKPHHHLAAGFYDGTVAIWDLTTKSVLQRVRQADGIVRIYPFSCFLAHDHAVKSVAWCKANSNFLMTAGNDRKIKFWDLRRPYEPINCMKRFLSTEVTWMLPYSGVTVAQDNCYASYGVCGVHYLDAGYLGFKAFFIAPRKGTVWSISGSDWLNSITAGDLTGEVIAAVLPDLNLNPSHIKRTSERRFPIYKADLLLCASVNTPIVEGASEEGHLAATEETGTDVEQSPTVDSKSYHSAVTRYSILYQDTDLRNFKHFLSREPMRRMHKFEAKGDLAMDRMLLESIHKVRFSPNLDSYCWIISGGQAGIVRVHCLKGLSSHISEKLLMECQAQFSAMYEDVVEETAYSPAVMHTLVELE
ncbi:general transcription factor 3C polypeptide 2 isoform X2 [Microcaecilia unicolor]|uniref:General transcription factor 3C polypeptide 2 n=1 Tax=Microcaecilia unicolor TaxID=1415580 RepID=A0A6P7XWL2_9AMPH|nr:general transcription factor 3C polypeptide 2 isoform X2 [Microcaecilia unicolor]